MRLPLVVCKASEQSPADLDHLADQVQLAPGGRFGELLRTATAPGDFVVKPLPSPRAGLGNRFVRQTHGLDDRTIVATSPARTDLDPP